MINMIKEARENGKAKNSVILTLTGLFAKSKIINLKIVTLDVLNARFQVIIKNIVGFKIKTKTIKQILQKKMKEIIFLYN